MAATATRPSTTRSPGRPAQTPTEAESAGLHRVADLAGSVLACLRKDGRQRYTSERELRAWLSGDGVPFSSNDLGPALDLLAGTGLLVRPAAQLGHPRPGWLPTKADREPVVHPRIKLARLVPECVSPSGSRPTKAQIAERLTLADEEVSDEQLSMIIQRLVDCGQLRMVQRQSSYPITYAKSGRWAYDETDDLAASICEVLRGRDEIGYESEDQLRSWLTEAGIDFDGRLFDLALGHLLRLGRLQSPRADTWQRPEVRPTWLVEPVPFTGEF